MNLVELLVQLNLKKIFSQSSERFKEGFSEVSREELTLFSEIVFVTFLSLDVTVWQG